MELEWKRGENLNGTISAKPGWLLNCNDRNRCTQRAAAEQAHEALEWSAERQDHHFCLFVGFLWC